MKYFAAVEYHWIIAGGLAASGLPKENLWSGITMQPAQVLQCTADVKCEDSEDSGV